MFGRLVQHLVKIGFGLSLAVCLFLISSHQAHALTITWDGGGSTNNWSECANWDNTNTCPGSGDAVVFSSVSTKASTIDASFTGTITSLSINTGYSGVITQSRSLTTSGLFTQATGTFTGGAALTIGTTLTVSGGTFSGAAPLSVGGNTTLSAGTMTLPTGADLNGNSATVGFSISGGTFNAPSGNMTVAGGFKVTNTPTINANGGTITFDSTTATIDCGNFVFSFGTVSFTGQTGVKSIINGCTLPLGASPTVPNGLTLGASTLTGSGTLTMTTGTFTINNASSSLGTSTFSGLVVPNLTLTNATIDLSGYTTFTNTGTVTVTSGTLKVPAGASLAAVNINGGTFTGPSGNVSGTTLTMSSGIFNAPTGTYTLTGNFNITSGTFNNLSGTFDFSGGNATLISCTGVTFSAANFIGQSGLKVINAGCTLPLGANPTIPQSLTLNGTLTGTGTLTFSAGVFTFQNGGSLVSFTGLVNNGATVVGPATGQTANTSLDLSTYTTVDFNGNFTVNTPTNGFTTTYKAPSGTMTAAGNFTVNTGTAYNANGGTLIFDSTTGGVKTISCDTASFFNIGFNSTLGSETVSSNCTFNVGANPNLVGSILLDGVLQGSGTLTMPTLSLLRIQNGGSIQGFSGLNVYNLSVIAGATADFSTYTPFVVNGSLNVGVSTISSGTLTMPANATIVGGLSVFTASVFTAPSGTLNLNGSLNVVTTATYNHNNGILNILPSGLGDTVGSGINCQGRDILNLVTINDFAVSGTIDSYINHGAYHFFESCVVRLGNNPVVHGFLYSFDIIGQPTTYIGTGTLTTDYMENDGQASYSGFSDLVVNNIYWQYAATSVPNIDFSVFNSASFGSVDIASGTFKAPSGLMTIRDDFYSDYVGGTFNANNGTVKFGEISAVHKFRGGPTYNNLDMTTTVDSTYSFVASTITVNGNLTMRGVGAQAKLRSRTPGLQWGINAQGSRLLNNLDVQDSNNVNATTMIATNSVDSGNNTNWSFSANPLNFNLISPADTSYVSSERPTFKWAAAITNANSSVNHYNLRVDNGESGNWEILDIPASGTTDYVTSKYTVHYEGFEDNDPANNSLSLTTKSSSDWATDQNDGRIKSGKHNWTVTAFDNAGNLQQMYWPILVDLNAPTLSIIKFGSTTKNFDGSYTSSSSQPVLFAKVIDAQAGSDSDNKIASGPQEVAIQVDKRNGLGVFSNYTTKSMSLSPTYWTVDNTLITDNFRQLSDKYASFAFTSPIALSNGTYRLTVSVKDLAGNTQQSSFLLKIINGTQSIIPENSTQTPAINTNADSILERPSPAPSPSPTVKDIYHSNLPTSSSIWQKLSGFFNQVGQKLVALCTAFRTHIATLFNAGHQHFSQFIATLFSRTKPTEISSVKVLVLSPTSARISWETNQPATGKINYGLDETYPFDVQTSEKSLHHEFTLQNLNPNTEYSFEVMSQGTSYTYDANRKFRTAEH